MKDKAIIYRQLLNPLATSRTQNNSEPQKNLFSRKNKEHMEFGDACCLRIRTLYVDFSSAKM